MGEDFSRHREIRFTNLDHWGGGVNEDDFEVRLRGFESWLQTY